jgi:hopanoid biosynthesis associated RND transporter like protein HpnN
MMSSSPSWSYTLSDYYDRHSWSVLAFALLSFVVAALIALFLLRLDTGRHDLEVTNSPNHATYVKFTNEFAIENSAVVIVSGPDSAHTHPVVDRLAATLSHDTADFNGVYATVDTAFVRHRLLQYVPLPVLEQMAQAATQLGPIVASEAAHPSLLDAFDQARAQVDRLMARAVQDQQNGTGNMDVERLQPLAGDAAKGLPVLAAGLDNLGSAVLNGASYQSVWQRMAATQFSRYGINGVPDKLYLDMQGGKVSLILLEPRETTADPGSTNNWVESLRAQLDHVQSQAPNVQIGLTGKPVIDYDQLRTSATDATRAMAVSLIGVALLFGFTFYSFTRPLIASACLLLGLAWTLAFAAITIGHLDTLTVIALPMLIGLGIDFAIQVMTRYEEERGAGQPYVEAMSRTMSGTGVSVILAAVTIALAFSATALTGLQAMQELAVVAGSGIVFCAIAMLVVLPAWLLLSDKKRHQAATWRPWTVHSLARVEDFTLAHAPAVVVVAMCVALFLVRVVRYVPFDNNLMDLQANTVDSMIWENRLTESTGHGILPAAIVARDVDEASRLREACERLPAVARAMSVAPLFPPTAAAAVPYIQQIQQALPARLGAPRPMAADEVPRLGNDVAALRQALLIARPQAQQIGGETLADALETVVASADGFLTTLRIVPAQQAAPRLNTYQSQMLADMSTLLGYAADVHEAQPLRLRDLPPMLRHNVVSPDGHILLAVFPRQDIWDPTQLREFVTELRSVAPDATGFPVVIYETESIVSAGYMRACMCAALAVLFITFLHFRSLLPTLLAMAPVAIGLVWLLGIQVYWNIPFNLANLVVVPLLLGIGAANGIYVVRRIFEDCSPRVLGVSTGRAILLSNGMALIGFGSLLVAHYQGIFTIGLIMSLGLLCSIVSSLIVLPAFFELLRMWSPDWAWPRMAECPAPENG